MLLSFDTAAPFIALCVIQDWMQLLHSQDVKLDENFFNIRHVCQSIFEEKLENLTCSLLSPELLIKVWFTWIIPGLVISLVDCGKVSTGGVRGLEEVFLTLARSWPWAPVWPGAPTPPPSLSSGLDSPENWKEKIFALKVFRNYANSERGTISLKFSNPISLKLNVILILNHLEQTRFTNPDKTL